MAAGASGHLYRGSRELLAGLTTALCAAVEAWAKTLASDQPAQRDHLEQLAKQRGVAVEVLLEELGIAEDDTPDIPEDGERLWLWFGELSAARGSSGFGMLPLSWQDIAAWSQITGSQPTPYEALTLRAMDTVFLTTFNEHRQKQEKP